AEDCVPRVMSGKTCVVTGASSGIGKVLALELARRGARVVMICRSNDRGRRAAVQIEQATGEQPYVLLAYLSSQQQIRNVAGEIDKRYERVDVLVNNAGALQGRKRRVTEDGLEMTFAVNHLAYFLLTNLLREKLEASAPARIVSTASAAHGSGKIDFEDLQSERSYSAFRAYANSKLANIQFTRELARRLEGTTVTVNCFHPGFVGSRFGSGATLPVRVFMLAAKPFITSPTQGADTGLWLACSRDIEGVSGQYFFKRAFSRSSRAARDDQVAARLWEVSAKLTGLQA
ncbi:MAG: SDR family oxidoreductase, partial [Dehalococcoidia bacterium]